MDFTNTRQVHNGSFVFLTLAETHGLIPFHYDFSSFLGGYLIRTEVTLPDEGIGQAD